MTANNLLTVTQFSRIIGYNPFFMYGFRFPTSGGAWPVANDCSKPVVKYSWQDSDNSGRDEIEQAIANAESILLKHLKYRVAPQYGEQTLNYPAFPQWATYRASWPSIQIDEGYLQALGIEALTLVTAAANVVYSDVDGDGLNDTFTIGPFATTETDPLVFRVYNSAAYRFDGSGAGEQWAIRPIKTLIAGGNATITGPAWLMGIPVQYERFNWNNNGLDSSDASNFVTTADVYTSAPNAAGTTQATAEALLTWQTAPWPWACCGPAPNNFSNDPAQLAYGFARGNVGNSQQGWAYAALAVYNAATATWNSSWWTTCRPPDRITLRYLAGYPVEAVSASSYYGQINPALQTVIARLAAAELTRPPLACENAGNRELAKWQFDLSHIGRNQLDMYATTREELNNPIGTQRGHVQAWKYIENNMKIQGVVISGRQSY